jgi:hypothetical protein
MEKARREARGMQGGPEAIARAGEVKAGRRGVQARVDAAEQDLQARRDDVAQALAARGAQVSRAGPA